jgi:hypothetical protein
MVATTAAVPLLKDYDVRRQTADELLENSQGAGAAITDSSWRVNEDPRSGLIVHRVSSMAEAEAYLAWRARKPAALTTEADSRRASA